MLPFSPPPSPPPSIHHVVPIMNRVDDTNVSLQLDVEIGPWIDEMDAIYVIIVLIVSLTAILTVLIHFRIH